MIAILVDLATGKHISAWTVDGETGHDLVSPAAGQRVLTWATTMETYQALATRLSCGEYGAVHGLTPALMTADLAGPAPPPPQSADVVKALCDALERLGAADTDTVSIADLKAAVTKLQAQG